MKPWVAFVLGSVFAASVAVIILKRPAAEEAAAPAEVATAAAPASTAIPLEPEQPKSVPQSGRRTIAATPVTRAANSVPTPVTKEEPASPAPAAAASQPAVPEEKTTPAVVERRPAALVAPAPPPEPNKVTLKTGTPIIVRLLHMINSDTATDGQSFEATLDQPIIVDGFAIAEKGSKVEGRIIDVEKAGRVKGVAHLSLELVRIGTSDGQRVNVSTQSWDKEGEQSKKQDAEKVAIGAAAGAALGAIFGGGKGAAVGAGSGGAAGGGVVLATRGKAVVLPVETKITFRLQSPVTITERR